MLGKQGAWERESVFDRIDVIFEVHEKTLKCLHAGFDSESLYTSLYNPRWPLTPQKLTAEINIEVGSLRLESLLAQIPPSP